MTKFTNALNGLENLLEGHKFIAGDDITIADISFSAFFVLADKTEMPMEPFPNVQHWLENISIQSWFVQTQRYLENILLGNAFN